MQKTYWWRIGIVVVGGFVFGWEYLAVNAFETNLCDSVNNCIFRYTSYTDSLMFLSLSLLITSPFLFFVQDNVFLKWLTFALAWFVITSILIALAPVSTGGWMSFGPTKESVSIWMGTLFIIVSLVKLLWDTKRTA